ncbi:anaerobic sulfatase maturase [Paenibacillus donghaensis]|uniref:Anaerobic sulfatase maturase n=2 Tax=Paenibacillus donghaensis TaxID=414771 RepID=A0A2Z2KKF4_9BACL|nr:anaerobic sulfatase maturase [Paenibacillus donghaensis]
MCAGASGRHVSVMWKTVSEDCNLACDYCYYSTCGGKPGKINRIESSLLDTFMKGYMRQTSGVAAFTWQGGEPLLAGLDFFEEVVSLQAKYAPPHTVISNSLQTNGTLLTDKWAAFLKSYNFLVGVSLDGPQEIHDARRVDALGQGSFNGVLKGIGHLRQHGVDFNILTVIHKGNVNKAAELLDFYKRENFDYVQFIPCMDFRSQETDRPGVYEITPEEYGEFEAFDIWYNNGSPDMSIRFFDNMMGVYMNAEAELCIHRSVCPDMLVLEQNGDAFPCDFFINEEWKLGNVGVQSLKELLSSPVYREFKSLKPRLPEPCRTCEWKSLCHGGCPRNRAWSDNRMSSDPDYFCASYKKIYAHADERMKLLAAKLRREQFKKNVDRYLKGHAPGRNEPCACGSSKKYKHCCMESM